MISAFKQSGQGQAPSDYLALNTPEAKMAAVHGENL